MINNEIRVRSLCRRHGIEYRKLRGYDAFVTYSPIPRVLCERHHLFSYDLGTQWLVVFEEIKDPIAAYNRMIADKPEKVIRLCDPDTEQRLQEIMAMDNLSPKEKQMLANSIRRAAVYKNGDEKHQDRVPEWYTSLRKFILRHNLLVVRQHNVSASLAQLKHDTTYNTNIHPIDYYLPQKYIVCEFTVTDVSGFKPAEHWWVETNGILKIVTKRRNLIGGEKLQPIGSMAETVAQLLLQENYDNEWYSALKQYAYGTHTIELNAPKYQAHTICRYVMLLDMAKQSILAQALGDITFIGQLNIDYMKKSYGDYYHGLDTFASYKEDGWTILIPWARDGGIDCNEKLAQDPTFFQVIGEWKATKSPLMELVTLSETDKVKIWSRNGEICSRPARIDSDF